MYKILALRGKYTNQKLQFIDTTLSFMLCNTIQKLY